MPYDHSKMTVSPPQQYQKQQVMNKIEVVRLRSNQERQASVSYEEYLSRLDKIVKKSIVEGHDKKEIKRALLNAGWTKFHVEKTLRKY